MNTQSFYMNLFPAVSLCDSLALSLIKKALLSLEEVDDSAPLEWGKRLLGNTSQFRTF